MYFTTYTTLLMWFTIKIVISKGQKQSNAGNFLWFNVVYFSGFLQPPCEEDIISPVSLS